MNYIKLDSQNFLLLKIKSSYVIKKLKWIIDYNPLLKKIIILIYSGKIIYWIYKIFNLKFSYSLLNKTKIKIFPKGQIAFGIFSGKFEEKELEVFQKLLTPGSTIIDAGANIGLYSIIGSKLVGPTGKIFSFEPAKLNYNLLLKNIELNKIKNIETINMGLGDKIGETLILSQNTKTGDAEKYISKYENSASMSGNGLRKNQFNETISMDTLDNFQLANNIKKIDFLKIDIEGYEYYLLNGAKNLLKKNPKIIILFECAEGLTKRAGTTQKAVFAFLKNMGLDIVYWNKKEKLWSDNQVGAMRSGQLIGGKNIMSILNKLT